MQTPPNNDIPAPSLPDAASAVAKHKGAIKHAIRRSGRTLTVAITDLIIDDKPLRESADANLTEELRTAYLEAPQTVPPLLVVKVGNKYKIVDGRHRRHSAILASQTKIRVTVVTMAPESIPACMLVLNRMHGQRLNRLEVRAAARAAIEADDIFKLAVVHGVISTRKVGALLCVSHSLVAELVQEWRTTPAAPKSEPEVNRRKKADHGKEKRVTEPAEKCVRTSKGGETPACPHGIQGNDVSPEVKPMIVNPPMMPPVVSPKLRKDSKAEQRNTAKLYLTIAKNLAETWEITPPEVYARAIAEVGSE